MNKVIVKKLGRHKALGMTNEFNPKSKIFIDPRQKPKTFLKTLIHEKLHLLHPDWSESRILKEENELGNFIWANGYRKVNQ